MTEPALDPAVLDSLRQLNQEGEPDVVTEVLILFRDDVPGRIAQLAAAAAARDETALHRTAHSLKGSAGNVGAHRLHALCRDLEAHAKAGRLDDAAGLVAAVEAEFRRVEAEIPRYLVD
ncbi:MAG: Hpt domain-containing protein [Acidobacteriota bacterium]